MRALSTLVFLTLAGGGLSAQDTALPPGVLLLSRIQRHVQQDLEHLPAYTCLETVQRSTTEGRNRKGLEPLDTIRLEILYSGRKELYASPGARNFREDHPSAYTAGGMMGDGIFASHLASIFASGSALFTYRGEDTVGRDRGWQHAVKYDFRIPLSQSGWSLEVAGGRGIVASRGSFWADPETLELLEVEVHADEIPATLPVHEVLLKLTYGRMRIGDSDIMLPQTAEMRLLELGGAESVNLFDFTHCRSYQAESSITFETPGSPLAPANATAPPTAVAPAAPAAESAPPEILPAGLIVPVTLATPVASDSSVGMLLDGRISSDVSLKGKLLIPAGSAIRGRIRRLEHYAEAGGYYAVGLEFTELEAASVPLRFYADLQSASGAPGLEWLISTGTTRGLFNTTETVRLPDLPGVGSFFIRGSKFSLPAGFRMQWKTRAMR